MIVRLLASSSSGIFRGNGYLKKIYEPLKTVDFPWVVGQNIYSRWSWLIKSFSFASPAKRQENVQGAFKTLPRRYDSEKVESSWKSSAVSEEEEEMSQWTRTGLVVESQCLERNLWPFQLITWAFRFWSRVITISHCLLPVSERRIV